jgi:hypothetical protein
MKSMLVAAAAVLAVVGLSSGPSEAAGFVKGAVIGGVAGHFLGHGLLGAGAGCAIGHHEANRREGYSGGGWDRSQRTGSRQDYGYSRDGYSGGGWDRGQRMGSRQDYGYSR